MEGREVGIIGMSYLREQDAEADGGVTPSSTLHEDGNDGHCQGQNTHAQSPSS